MAKKAKANGDDTLEKAPPSNSKARAVQIRSVMKKIEGFESERRRIGEEIRELKTKEIKGDLGMKIGDFNAASRLYALDDEARAEYLETLVETFGAVGKADQLSLLLSDEAADGDSPSS